MTPPPRPLRVRLAVLGLFLHTALTPAAPPAPAVPAAEAERLLYAQQVAQAQLEWASGDVARMNGLLEACPPALRQWEWHYLRRLADGAALTFRGHRSSVTATAWAPDGRRVASGGWDGTVHVWDPETGQLFFSLHGHRGGVGCVAFSPDGKFLVTSNGKFQSGVPGAKIVEPSKVRVWDAASGRLVKPWTEHGVLVERLAFTPDGKSLVAVGSDKISDPWTLHVWDIGANKTAGKLPLAETAFLDIAPDGQLVVIAPGEKKDDPRRVQFLAAGTFKATRSWPVRGSLQDTSLRPDGRRVAAILYNEERLVIWDTDKGEEVLRVPVKGTSLHYSGDGRRLAVTEQGGVGIYDAETGKKLGTLREREEWSGIDMRNRGGVWSRDGRRLLTAPQPYFVPPYDTFFGAVKVWDLGEPRGAEPLAPERRTLAGHRGRVRALAFSPDGRRLASGDEEGTVRLCDAATGQLLRELPQKDGRVRALRFTPNGQQLLVVSSKLARTWDADTGKEVRSRDFAGTDRQAISPDGKWLASGEWIWAVDGEQSLRLGEVRSNGVIGVDFSPDGKLLVVGYGGIPGTWEDGAWGPRLIADNSSPGPVIVWDAATGKEVRRMKGLRGYVWPYSPTFSHGGKLIAADCGKWGVQVWDAATGEPRLRLPGRDHDETGRLAFSPDGRRLFAAGSRAVDIFDVTTGREALTIRAEGQGLALSPDGACLAVGGRGEVRLYDSVAAVAPATALRRQAVARVRALYDQGLLRDEVLARLEKEKEPNEALRAALLDVARGSAENAGALCESAWEVVRKPGGKEADYRAALARAERAVQLNADDARAKLAAGAGHYRLGDHKKAIKVLGEASAVVWEGVTGAHEVRPREVDAFLGLAQFRLGSDEVRVASNQLTHFVTFLKEQEAALEKYRKERGEQGAAAVGRRLHLDDQRQLLPEVEEALKKIKGMK
jgi:WD40 repeat protein